MERDISCNWEKKKPVSAIFKSDWVIFKSKSHKRQWRSPHDDKAVNSSRGYSNCKYIPLLYLST